METLVKVFENSEFGEVEVLVLDKEILFNANHVARILGIEKVRNTIAGWDERYRRILTNSNANTMGIRKFANRGETFLTEAGLYKLIFKSRKPNAEKFQDWVVLEVLPSIRKQGYYVSPKVERLFHLDDPNIPEYFKAQLVSLLEDHKKALIEKEQYKEIIQLLRHSGKTYSATQLSQELQLKSANHLNSILKSLGIIEFDGETWLLTEKFRETGWLKNKQGIKDGEIIFYSRWTDDGRLFILKLFKYIEDLERKNKIDYAEKYKISAIQSFIDKYLNEYMFYKKSNSEDNIINYLLTA